MQVDLETLAIVRAFEAVYRGTLVGPLADRIRATAHYGCARSNGLPLLEDDIPLEECPIAVAAASVFRRKMSSLVQEILHGEAAVVR